MRTRTSLSLALLLLGCSSQTQLVVVVETNLDVPLEIDTVEVAVRGPEGVSTVAPQALDGPDAPSFPLTLGVSPATDALGPITVTAIGRLAGVEVLRQAATLTLSAGETRYVHLVLYRSCLGRACDATETCDADGCGAQARDDLPLWTGQPPTYDDSDPCLALLWDVDGDGEGSVACGGTDCDDTEPLASMATVEDCDGIDNNCDGVTDEDCDCSPLDALQDCTTSCGTTGEQVCTTTGWSSCALPEEICNAIDDDCDGLTDEDLPYAATVPRPITDGDNDSVEPDMIWTGAHHAVIWSEDSDVYFQTVDESGASLRDPARVARDGRDPVLAWSGSTYGALWWWPEMVSTTRLDRMLFSVLGADGAPRIGVQQVAGDASTDPAPSIVWDGSQYVLGYRDGDMTLEARGEGGDRVGARYQVPADREDVFGLVWTGTRLALSFARGGTVYFTQGQLGTFPPMERVVATFPRPEFPSMVWTGDGFLIAVSADPSFRGGGPLSSLHLDPTGALVGTATVLSPSQAEVASFGSVIPAGMAAAPGQVLVTWIDDRDLGADAYFARLAPDGTVLQPATRISGPGGSSTQTTIAWSGQSFGTIWSEDVAGSRQLMFSRIACDPMGAP